jgi:hypothetical protein
MNCCKVLRDKLIFLSKADARMWAKNEIEAKTSKKMIAESSSETQNAKKKD